MRATSSAPFRGPRAEYAFKYAREWVETKRYWKLAVHAEEREALETALRTWLS